MEGEPPNENVDPRASPSATVAGGRGAVPSRGVVIEEKIADASGRAAKKVMLEALKVKPAQEARIFARVVCSGVDDPELGNNAVQVPEVCHVVEILKVMDDEQRARTRERDVPGRSRPRLEIASSCPEERATSAGGKLRCAAQRP